MAKTIEELISKHEAARAAEEALKNKIPQLQAKLDQLRTESDAAARKGDLTLYQAKKKEIEDTADAIYLIHAQMEDANHKIPEAEAREAWKDYAEKYGKTFLKAWGDYEKQREQLLESFMALVKGQSAAQKIRERLADCCEIDLGALPGEKLDKLFPMTQIPSVREGGWRPPLLRTPDTDFFLQLRNNADLDLFNNVIRLHVSQ